MELLVEGKVKLSVSSVLDRNAKEYGKKFLLDGEEDTCWNSDQVFARIFLHKVFYLLGLAPMDQGTV